MEHILVIFIITIAIATILNVFLKKLDIPTVIGYILSGLAISTMFHFAQDSKEMLSHLAEFGIVFLMFTIGLEFSMTHLKSMKKEVFVYGGLEVILSGLLFTALSSWILELEMKTAIIVGFALSLSSTAIVLKILNENKEIRSNYGRIALGILLFQDLAVIPILLMISFFGSQTDSLGVLLFETFVSALVVFFIIFVGGKYFIERFFDWITSTDSEEIFLGAVILGVVSASVLAEYFGFSYSLGAFLAGMALSETKYRYRIEADLVPFRDILLGVFFVTIGMQINLESFITYGDIILMLLVGVLLLKGLLIFVMLQFFIPKRTALKSALALFQVGEFALAVFALAYSQSLIDEKLNQIMIITIVVSMIITPFVLRNISKLANIFFKEPVDLEEHALIGERYRNHIVICGYGPVGKILAKKFREQQLLYVILEHNVKVVDKAIEEGEKAIFLANAAQKMVLEHFNVDESIAIIVTIENAIQMQLICENIVTFNRQVNSIVKVVNTQEKEMIESLGINHVLNGKELIADRLLQEALECRLEQ
ncbi:MAG: Glutathione-regulated potassium-efflux system protein KefB [uncultured Sulfurovum sp.]|uniref:Glutathione-regulated potassium-efflux system protein KefB n=1 Tax=uncultured Sulfurovum sp. TaxID=269237 RepID=A0A6S6S695_9BACT|nr:MAG: Glutathione-regulated potassium-efflux system protein KefB [uncultured Sulfurovum sp.]